MTTLSDLAKDIERHQLLDRVRGTFLGVALGDALGVPHEFRNQRHITYTGKLELTPKFRFDSQYRGTRTRTDVIGQYSDDTEMTLANLRCIIREGGYQEDSVIESYIEWANSSLGMGKNTRYLFKGIKIGTPRSNPARTYRNRWKRKFGLVGGTVTESNGSLMRCSMLCYLGKESILVTDCNLTNPSSVNRDCSMLYARIMLMAASDKSKDTIKSTLLSAKLVPSVRGVVSEALRDSSSPARRNVLDVGKGWVLHALYCAIWAFFRYDSYSEGVNAVISLSGDTDTNAAIAGGLLGARLGISQMRKETQTSENLDVLLSADFSEGENPRPEKCLLSDIDALTAQYALFLSERS